MKTGSEGRGGMRLLSAESIRSKSLHFGARSLEKRRQYGWLLARVYLQAFIGKLNDEFRLVDRQR